MASRVFLTVEEVLQQLDECGSGDEEYGSVDGSGSEDDFEGYVNEEEYREAEDSQDEIDDEDCEEENEMDVCESSDAGIAGAVPTIPPYTGQPGCTATLPENSRPIDYFSLLIDTSILQHVVDQTNVYSQQQTATHTIGPRSRMNQWGKKPHTISELRQFIALIIAMGIVRYPSVESYWNSSWPFHTKAFSSVSSRKKSTKFA